MEGIPYTIFLFEGFYRIEDLHFSKMLAFEYYVLTCNQIKSFRQKFKMLLDTISSNVSSSQCVYTIALLLELLHSLYEYFFFRDLLR